LAEKADIVEVFSSIQGEGLYIGERQIFVRFFPCNLSCAYCDTPTDASKVRDCLVEVTPGRQDWQKIKNPMSVNDLMETVKGFIVRSGRHHSISLTGGEPLLQVAFLKEWFPIIGGDQKIYLETNGTLHEELGELIDFIDIISMDIKLPGTSGIEPMWDEHRLFLEKAIHKEVFVKVVVSGDTAKEEFSRAVRLVKGVDRRVPLIIQPMTPPYGGKDGMPSPAKLIGFHEEASADLETVKVIPQSHKMMGML